MFFRLKNQDDWILSCGYKFYDEDNLEKKQNVLRGHISTYMILSH